ncbi:putative sterigmatocystin biosynthesis monooxygenase stcW [Neofusicoccum parvum]|nr:putative sterigmatocystin biosynthesis monooxygenase stcW [Neofusicoccum parvum]
MPPPTPPSPRATNPIHHERPLRIITVGAGAAGLLVAYKLRRSFARITHTVYEKNADVAGTWHENRYPGCACDVPAHVYTYSFAPNPAFSRTYASATEIKAYFRAFADRHGLARDVRLRRRVRRAAWDAARGVWGVEVEDADGGGEVLRDECEILIDATGFLNGWEWPAVEGLRDFRGELMHTADWPAGFDFRGKRVGLIGNGSSAIQVLPAIQPHVESVTTFIRSPTYIAPPIGPSGQREYTADEKRAFETQPGALLSHRKDMENGMNSLFAVFLKDSPEQAAFTRNLAADMRAKLAANPALAATMIPSWSAGCRRFTPGPGYLEALQAGNVRVLTGAAGDVVRVTADGATGADGVSHGFDALICATGFDTSFRPRFAVVGAGGADLRDAWADDPRGYLAVAAAGFPNYLTLFGPNSPTGNGPVLPAIEAQVDYVLRFVDRVQTENIRSFAPKREAVEDFNDHLDAFMARTVWSEDCRSWYKKHSKHGRITGLWPGSMLHFLEAIREPRWDDWEIEYWGNRFAWLGNGFSQLEVDPDGDLSYYIREEDDGEFSSRRKRRQALTGKRKGSAKAKL